MSNRATVVRNVTSPPPPTPHSGLTERKTNPADVRGGSRGSGSSELRTTKIGTIRILSFLDPVSVRTTHPPTKQGSQSTPFFPSSSHLFAFFSERKEAKARKQGSKEANPIQDNNSSKKSKHTRYAYSY